MNDFEMRLKELPLPGPSSGLKRRIFGHRPRRRPALGGFIHRRVSLGWAMAFSLVMGATGFALAQLRQAPPRLAASAPAARVQVHIVEAPTARNVFDFSQTTTDIPQGAWDVRVETNNEV